MPDVPEGANVGQDAVVHLAAAGEAGMNCNAAMPVPAAKE